MSDQVASKKQFFRQPILFMSVFVAMATAVTELPFWIIIFSLVLILWRLAYEELDLPRVSTIWSTLIGALLFALTYAQYRTIWGQVESAAILVGLISISILNYQTERDHRILILLGFILAAMKPMFVIDLVWAIPSFVCLVGLWISLIPNIVLHKWKFFTRISLYSLPLLALLFALFPRIVIFQSSRYNQNISTSGFSEDLNPGRFASLVQSDRTAFFSEFDRDIMLGESKLANKDLYWRGSILAEGSGFEWKRRQRNKSSKAVTPQQTGRKGFNTKFNYSVIMEPMDHRIVFTLDVPSQLKPASIVVDTSEYSTIRLAAPLTQQRQFDFNADPSFKTLNDPTEDAAYLELKNVPPKTKEWITEANKQNLNVDQKLKLLERFFSLTGFRYTLNPGVYDKNDLDEFLFSRRKGFCEHFAAAYTTLARGLKIPARVIIGYQGGEYNNIGNFWKISQRDAHAWVEVAVQDQWVRIDPTMWIAPLRLNVSARQFFSLSDADQILFSRDSKLVRNNFEFAWNQLTHLIENINYSWTVFLLEYDKEKQLALLSEFLEKDQIVLMITWVGYLVVLFLAFRILRRLLIKKTRRQVLSEILRHAESELTKKRLPISKTTVPTEIIQLIREHFPKSKIDDFEKIYDQENYINNFSESVTFFEQRRLKAMIVLEYTK